MITIWETRNEAGELMWRDIARGFYEDDSNRFVVYRKNQVGRMTEKGEEILSIESEKIFEMELGS